MKRVYISGPMTGYVDYNYPAFHAAAKHIRESGNGFAVINPAELTTPADHKQWADYMKQDIRWLIDCDAVAVLPNWRESKGARIEVFIAAKLGLEVFYADTFEPVDSAVLLDAFVECAKC